MSVPNATKLAACQAASNIGKYVSVHTAAAGTTGSSEATGGGYARQLGTATNGAASVTIGPVSVPVAAGTYVEAGAFSAASSGTFAGSGAFSGGNVVVSGTGAKIDVTLTWS